jgi:D-inositol-3-phosphate glycosyltransferase
MATYLQTVESSTKNVTSGDEQPSTRIKVALLSGGFDRHYSSGLTMALASKGVYVDFIGGAEVDGPEMHHTPGLTFFDLYWDPRKPAGIAGKLYRIAAFYLKLFRYTLNSRAKIFHLLWNNKVQLFDRTLLMLYYKLLGKKIVFTAHNVNAAQRDGNDSILNRLTLKIQYRLSDHILVHTEKMKSELLEDFGVPEKAISIIPFGVNNVVPDSSHTSEDARKLLGFGSGEKIILFYGSIRPYKGLEYLVTAFQKIASKDKNYRLVIAGEEKKGSEEYLREILKSVESGPGREQVIQKIEFISDEDTELYFKAADVSVLPYKLVFQSGVLFLSYGFGLPVIASDVGSFRDEIIEGETGFVCKPDDAEDLAQVIEKYFASDLYRNLDNRRAEVRNFVNTKNSWEVVGNITFNIYSDLLNNN